MDLKKPLMYTKLQLVYHEFLQDTLKIYKEGVIIEKTLSINTFVIAT